MAAAAGGRGGGAFEVVRHVEGEREGEKEEAGEGDPSTKAKAPLVVK